MSPQIPVNQSTVSPAPAVADRVEETPMQTVAGEAVGVVGVPGCALTVTVTLAQLELQLGTSQRAK